MKVHYALAMDSVIYVMLNKCPDVSYALSNIGRYQASTGASQRTTVITIQRYLRSISDIILVKCKDES